nr:hypothetical protein [Tanacetum cinerariifolium]
MYSPRFASEDTINQADTGNIFDLGRPGKDVDANIAIGSDANVLRLKNTKKRTKIGSKQNKNGKRVEAGKSLKQLQLKEEEKPKKTKKRMAENAYTYQKLCKFKEKKKREGPYMQFFQTFVIDGEPADGEFPLVKTSFADTVNQTNDRGIGECHAAVNDSSPLLTKGSYANVVNASV